MVEHEYFGNLIFEFGTNDFVGRVFNADEDVIEIKGTSLDDVKEKMDAYFRLRDKNDLYERIDNAFDVNRNAFEFFYKMIVSMHSCEGAALMRMQDYCNAKNI